MNFRLAKASQGDRRFPREQRLAKARQNEGRDGGARGGAEARRRRILLAQSRGMGATKPPATG